MMMRNSLFLLVALALPVSAGAASLRPESVVNGSEVMLSDIFLDLPFEKDKTLAPAPAPGRQLVFEGRQLASIARNNGLDWQPDRDARVVVTRASQSFDAAAIGEAVATELRRQGKATIDVLLDNSLVKLYAPTGRNVDVNIASIAQNGSRFSAVAQLVIDGQVYAQSPISGRVRTMVSLPVLARAVAKGEVINATDIGWQDMEASAGMDNVVHDADDVLGKEARNALRAGVPLRPIDLLTPALIAKGNQVTLVYKTAGVQITTPARALTSGAAGDVVRAVNLVSSRTVEGVVLSDGTVRVGPTNIEQASLPLAPVN